MWSVQHSHSAPVANVGLNGQCTSGACLLHVLDFPAPLREQGLQGEGSRQDKVHRALPCRGTVPETSSLWLKPKPLGNSCFSHSLSCSPSRSPWPCSQTWQPVLSRHLLMSSQALPLPPFFWSQVQNVGGGTGMTGSSGAAQSSRFEDNSWVQMKHFSLWMHVRYS